MASDILFYKNVDKQFNANGIKANFHIAQQFKKKPKCIETIIVDSPAKSLELNPRGVYRIFTKKMCH